MQVVVGHSSRVLMVNVFLVDTIAMDLSTALMAVMNIIAVSAGLQCLPRDALVHSAVLRLHVVRLSVCLSVCGVVT